MPISATGLAWTNGPYSIKRHGTSISNCDLEPIKTPGCIQSHGVLLVLRSNDLVILQASENAEPWLGKPLESLLGVSFGAALGTEHEALLRTALEQGPLERNPCYVFTLPSRTGAGPLDVLIHTDDGLVIVEFENAGRGAGSAIPDYFTLFKPAVTRLQTSGSLPDFCQRVAEEFYALTGLDRVMVYRFHADFHGEVFAESKRSDLPSWLGLHYPAADIPASVRALFEKVWIRPLPDVLAPPVELVPLANPETGQPLDMTYCALRGISVMHTEYLRNMGVSATLTMPIRRDNTLWGLIACHHYTPTTFPYQLRTACEFLAQVVSLEIKTVNEQEDVNYRSRLDDIHSQLIASAALEGELAVMTEGRPNLLDGIDTGGVALNHSDRWWRIGRTPSEAELEKLAVWLSSRPELESHHCPAYVTDNLAHEYPEAKLLEDLASGLLAVSLSRSHRSLILWFRPETVQTVNWGGCPHDKPTVLGPNGPRLTPRSSFELFTESVRGRSLPWKTVEIEAALRLRTLITELVFSFAERLASINAELTRSNQDLDTASHDLQEPLRGISSHARQLLSSPTLIDKDDREQLESLTQLTLHMDRLLDALQHCAHLGRAPLLFETVELNEVVKEALEMLGDRRASDQVDIVMPRPLPTIHCDRNSVREIFANLLDNSFKYNDQAQCRVEIGYLSPGYAGELPGAPREANRRTVFYVLDNGIGIEPHHCGQVFKLFKRLHEHGKYGGGTGAGLAIVKMLVGRHYGQVWLDSIPGKGSTFYFTLGVSRN